MSQSNKNKGSKIARQTAARLAAVQAVYQMKANDQSAKSVISEFKAHRMGVPLEEQEMVLPDGILFEGIVDGVSDRQSDIKEVIDTLLSEQNKSKSSASLDSMEPLLGSVLLCGAFELLAHHDIDAPIIISDYLEVTHAFYEGGESKLVNGILDNVSKTVRDI